MICKNISLNKRDTVCIYSNEVYTIRNYVKICHILGVEMPSEGRIDANRLFKKVIYIKIYIFKFKYKK